MGRVYPDALLPFAQTAYKSILWYYSMDEKWGDVQIMSHLLYNAI